MMMNTKVIIIKMNYVTLILLLLLLLLTRTNIVDW